MKCLQREYEMVEIQQLRLTPPPHTHPVHMLGSSFGCKHGQDAGPAADVQHYFVLEDVLVVVHGVPVGERPHFVLQHLLVGHI